jgi:hypothetical protein
MMGIRAAHIAAVMVPISTGIRARQYVCIAVRVMVWESIRGTGEGSGGNSEQ